MIHIRSSTARASSIWRYMAARRHRSARAPCVRAPRPWCCHHFHVSAWIAAPSTARAARPALGEGRVRWTDIAISRQSLQQQCQGRLGQESPACARSGARRAGACIRIGDELGEPSTSPRCRLAQRAEGEEPTLTVRPHRRLGSSAHRGDLRTAECDAWHELMRTGSGSWPAIFSTATPPRAGHVARA